MKSSNCALPLLRFLYSLSSRPPKRRTGRGYRRTPSARWRAFYKRGLLATAAAAALAAATTATAATIAAPAAIAAAIAAPAAAAADQDDDDKYPPATVESVHKNFPPKLRFHHILCLVGKNGSLSPFFRKNKIWGPRPYLLMVLTKQFLHKLVEGKSPCKACGTMPPEGLAVSLSTGRSSLFVPFFITHTKSQRGAQLRHTACRRARAYLCRQRASAPWTAARRTKRLPPCFPGQKGDLRAAVSADQRCDRPRMSLCAYPFRFYAAAAADSRNGNHLL